MKNIHVLPTENSSRLSYNKDGVLELHRLQWRKNTQNIYITSDEEIKDGDWYISLLENEVYKATKETQNIMSVVNLVGSTSYKKTHFKIILTTDQDLIKDGVQAIDDEFIEWFVNNPSCEEVEVVNKYYYNGSNNEIPPHISLDNLGSWGYGKYKIIIPKEQTKTNSFCETPGENCTMNYCDENGCQNRKRELADIEVEASVVVPKEEVLKTEVDWSGFPKSTQEKVGKQETLEEAKNKAWENYEYGHGHLYSRTFFDAFELGYNLAKEQDKNKYSEEEVLEQLNILISLPSSTLDKFTDDNGNITMKWFEQFKNK